MPPWLQIVMENVARGDRERKRPGTARVRIWDGWDGALRKIRRAICRNATQSSVLSRQHRNRKQGSMGMDNVKQPQQAPAKPLGGLAAYLSVEGAIKAAKFYGKAFGAETKFFYPPDEQGRTMHVHLYLNGSSVMLGDPYP